MDPYLSLQEVVESSSPQLETTFVRLAEVLSAKTKDRAVKLRFSIIDDGQEVATPWYVAISKQDYKVVQDSGQKPDVEIITSADVWMKIAEGRLSPLKAFVGGQLRVRGDIDRAKRIFLSDLVAGRSKLPDWLE